jgi:hypothetical protein
MRNCLAAGQEFAYPFSAVSTSSGQRGHFLDLREYFAKWRLTLQGFSQDLADNFENTAGRNANKNNGQHPPIHEFNPIKYTSI